MNYSKLTATVTNTPEVLNDGYFTVARVDHGQLWYYGQYETRERAKEVVGMIGGECVILQNEPDVSDDGK